MQTITTIGLDIAKSVFQVHGVDAEGHVIVRRQLKRRYVLAFFQKLPRCLIGIEACASSHYWSRELRATSSHTREGPTALARKVDTRWLMMFGLASFGLAMWSYSFITHDWGANELLIPQILRGFPQVFAVAPSVNLGLGSLPPARLKYASGLFNMMRNLGGAVGIAVCAAIINARTNFHFVAIASNLTPANGAMTRLVDGMAKRYGALPGSPEAGHVAALRQLWELAYREASTLAYADAFRAVMIAFAVATLLVPLMRNVAPGGAPRASSPAAH